jgi:hypothetical protein
LSFTHNTKLSVLVNPKQALKLRKEVTHDLNIQFHANAHESLGSISIDLVFPNVQRVPIYSHKRTMYKFDNKELKYKKIEQPISSDSMESYTYKDRSSWCPFKLVSSELCFQIKELTTLDNTIYSKNYVDVKPDKNKYYYDKSFEQLENRDKPFEIYTESNIFYSFEVIFHFYKKHWLPKV